MCGIGGIWGHPTQERLRSMGDALRHRGPDDQSIWIKPEQGIGFAHRRLSIIDLPTGRQPIANEDGRVVTVFNGEIYNYRELREELLARGHRLVTQSDTEVIVHLYEELGPALASKLRGMFAIAIWDDRQQQLVLLRDRVGKKPLYYSGTAGEFLFASEIKGILAALADPVQLDGQALVDYFTWTVIPSPRTIYREIRTLAPGEWLVVQDRRVVRRARYWRLRMSPKLAIRREVEAVERVDELLRESVRLRLRADVPVGCFLSGGIDSGLVAAIAAKQHSAPLTTITVGFEDEAFDERPLARQVAERYATHHHEIVLHPAIHDDLPRIAAAYDQPFGDSSAIPSYYLAQAARPLVKSVLNGDGGDEVFAGYRRYLAARLCGRCGGDDARLPRWGCRWLNRLLPKPRTFRSRYAFLHRVVRGLAEEPWQRYLTWSVDGIGADELRRLGQVSAEEVEASPPAAIDDPDFDPRHVWERYADCGSLDRAMAMDFHLILPHDLLVKVDIASMAHGLEVRSPLLDHELIETASRFREALKLHGLRTKPLLRSLAARYLPSAIQKAPKRGLEVPLVRWLCGPLRGLVEDVVLSKTGLLTDLFDRPALERLVSGEQALDPARWSRRVWLLLMLGLWDQHANRGRAMSAQAP
jgi:asparagine synthase (glutamine-hydrolysing)